MPSDDKKSSSNKQQQQQRLQRHPGRNTAFKAFRDLRMMRGDQAVSHLSSVPDRYATSAVLSELRKSAGGPQHLNGRRHGGGAVGVPNAIRGRKRAAAKRALKALYHNLVTPVLPIAYVVASAFGEDNARATSPMLSTLANSPANALSRWFGKFAGSRHVPKFLHQRMIHMMVKVYGIDVSQIEKPISEYNTLQEFFSRRLVPDARPPHPSAPLVSPCDGELLRCGEVVSGMMVQVKGNEYPLSDLMGVPLPNSPAGCRRWFYLFHLRPKDYHRFHAPCDAVVHETVHLPGYLFPVTQTAAKWVPNLFAELERVSVVGRMKDNNMNVSSGNNNNNNGGNNAFLSAPPSGAQLAAAAKTRNSGGNNNNNGNDAVDETPAELRNTQRVFAMVPMGATCVGSISLGFDQRVQTNKTSSLTNLWSLFSFGSSASSAGNSHGNNNGNDSPTGQTQQQMFKALPAIPQQQQQQQQALGEDGDAGDDNEDDEQHDDAKIDGEDDNEYHYEFVPPRSPLQQLSHYGQRPGKRTVYRRSERPEVSRGGEVGWFNWGSAIVVVADLPHGWEPCLRNMQEVRVGQPIAAPVGSAARM